MYRSSKSASTRPSEDGIGTCPRCNAPLTAETLATHWEECIAHELTPAIGKMLRQGSNLYKLSISRLAPKPTSKPIPDLVLEGCRGITIYTHVDIMYGQLLVAFYEC
jgi:hypothetical protein